MKHFSTYLIILTLCVLSACAALAQDVLNPSLVLWSAPLSASTVKAVVDAGGNTWALSSPNTFQVIDPLGKVRWTKTLSALTVADFAIDQQGQLLLVGLPATGQPVLEKYDAAQTLAWRNVLDSLSNVPGQASNLSVTLTDLGGGIVLGLNAKSDRKLSYYAFGTDGKIRAVRSVQSATNNRMTPVRPVAYNKNEILFGFNQPDDLYTSPTFYRLRVDSLTASQQKTEQPSVNNFLYATTTYSPKSPTSEVSSPLLTDGQTAYAIFSSSYRQGEPGSATTVSGYVLANFTYRSVSVNGPKDEPSIQSLATLQTDLATVAGSMSSLLDSRGNLFTTHVASSSSSTADLILNRYDFNNERAYSTLHLVKSIKVGTASIPSTNPGRTINRLQLLKSNADGSLLISGTTTGTLTISKNTFAGTLDAPTQFLMTIAAEVPNQSLSADQIKWTTNLPTGVLKVFSNARQQSWVQLTDSTFRYYSPQGKLGWEKKMTVEGIRDAGVDLQGNLYTLGSDAVYAFDSTGSTLWKLSYRPKGQYSNAGRLAIRPGGGGVFLEQGNSGIDQTEFDAKGNLLVSKSFFRADGYSFTLNGSPVQLNNRIIFNLNYTFLRNSGGYGTYLIDYSGAMGANGEVVQFTGPSVWQGADSSTIYSITNLFTGVAGGLPTYSSYSFSAFNFINKSVVNEANTPRVNTIGSAKAWAVTPTGTLFTLNTSSRAQTVTTTSYDLGLNEYSPSLDLRNTTRLGTFTLINGQTSKTSWELVRAYADGSLLLSGITSGTLTIGNTIYMGSSATPARFLTLINSVVAQVTTSATAVCQGSNAVLQSRYKGYLAQAPIIQLSNAQGSFAQPSLSLQVPLSQSALADTTLIAVSLPVPATLATGTYRVRMLVGTLVSEWASLTVTATPAALTARQEGDELVGTGSSGSYQWYDTQNKPIAGATDARYKPQTAGSYYVVNTANGCASAPSNRLAFIILATEPAATVEVYPNPATDRLFVRWPGAGTGARIKLLNTQGRVLQDVPRQGEVTNVPTQGLAGGLVLVQLQDEGQPTLVRKVLIQR